MKLVALFLFLFSAQVFSLDIPVQWKIHDHALYLLPDASLFVKDTFFETNSLTENNYSYPGYHSQALTYSSFLYASRLEGQRYRLFISRPKMGASVVYARDTDTERVTKGGSGYYTSPELDIGCAFWDHALPTVIPKESLREYYSFLYGTYYFTSAGEEMNIGFNYETINHFEYGANRLYTLYFGGLYGFGMKYTRIELGRFKTRDYGVITYDYNSEKVIAAFELRRVVSGSDYAPTDLAAFFQYKNLGLRRVSLRDYSRLDHGRSDTQLFFNYATNHFTVEPYVAYVDHLKTPTVNYVGEDFGMHWSASYGTRIMGFIEGYHSVILGGDAQVGMYAATSLFESDLGIACKGWYYSKREYGESMKNGFSVSGELTVLRRLLLAWTWNDLGKDEYNIDFTLTWEFEG